MVALDMGLDGTDIESRKSYHQAPHSQGEHMQPVRLHHVRKATSSTVFKNLNETWRDDKKLLVKRVIKQLQDCHDGHFDSPFFLGDLENIKQQYEKWTKTFPRIKPFYERKSPKQLEEADTITENFSEDPALNLLAEVGSSFDCANKQEIDRVLGLGVDSSRIIFANTVKTVSSLQYASDKKVSLMTFDNEEELGKIRKYFPGARLVLRIHCKEADAVVLNFGMKFGCSMDKVDSLLHRAMSLSMIVVGVSFHVGSLASSPSLYTDAIRDAHTAFQTGRRVGFNFSLLDIGGGFADLDNKIVSFETLAEVVNSSLDYYFPPSSGVRIIAEPGRFMVTAAYTWVVKVIGKRSNETLEEGFLYENGQQKSVKPRFIYYVNDGIYGSKPKDSWSGFKTVTQKALNNDTVYSSVVFGPTCDALDVVHSDLSLPELSIGDWLYLDNAGAYSLAMASDFHMAPKAKCHYI